MSTFLKSILTLAFCSPLTGLADVAKQTATTAATAPVDPLSVSNVLNMLFGLALVIGVILAMAWLVRRMGGFQMAGTQQIRLLGGMSLGPREKVVLIQVENKRLILGVAQGQVNTLHVLDGDYTDAQVSASDDSSSFRDKLLQALQKKPGA